MKGAIVANPFETAGRLEKATRLADFLERNRFTMRLAAYLNEDQWADLTKRMEAEEDAEIRARGEVPTIRHSSPSKATQDLVIAMLRRRGL